jgi:hypothetical protein
MLANASSKLLLACLLAVRLLKLKFSVGEDKTVYEQTFAEDE